MFGADCSQVQGQIAALFAEKLNVDVPSAETDLIDIGLLDSLKFVELLFEMEQQFAVLISLEDLEIDNFRSIQRIAEFVTAHSQVQARASNEKLTP